MQRYNGQLINQFANVINGNAAAGALVTVKLKSTGATVTLYAEDNLSGATLANPLTADSKGYYGFYAPDGVYTLDVSISGTPQLEIQLQDVAALQAQFDAALANAGYIPVGTFAAGCTVSQSNGVVSDGSSFWRWDGALPKTVTAGSAPTPTGAGNWILISDEALRGDLAASDSVVVIAGLEAKKLVAKVEHLTPEQFFIAGEIDDTGMIMRMGAAIVDGTRCEFQQKEYLISYAGTGLTPLSNAPYGVALIDLNDKKNVTLNGNNCTIKLVNHNITANGGLMFCRGIFVPNLHASGFNFDYTCTGVNTSGSYYPWIGGFVVIDPVSGTNDVTKISNDLTFEDMTFKLYHPYGQWATSPNAYSGDPNNGYKLFTVFVSGDYSATLWKHQNRNVIIRGIILKDGHNGYGLWAWACNNVKFINPTAENFTAKYSNHLGAFVGTGVPLVRYHQFYCTDVLVENINFNGMKSGDKTAGYEGASLAILFTSNNTAGNLTNGYMEVRGGMIRGGNGDLANAAKDRLILCTAYGVLKIQGVQFDAHPTDANSTDGGCVVYSSEATGGTGYGELHLSDVEFSKNCDKYQSIQIANGSNTSAADRRCKLVKLDNVHSLCQFQYGFDLSGNSAATYQGCERVEIDGLTIDGRSCVTFNSASTNSRAMFLTSSSGDVIRFNRLTIDSKYYAMAVASMNAGSSLIIDDYEERAVTTRYLGAGKIAVIETRGNGTPESVQVAAVGSKYMRLDGGAATTLYIKETGTGNTGWAAK